MYGRRGLTALFWSNINPYGTFRLDMNKHLDLAQAAVPNPRWAAAPTSNTSAPPGVTGDYQPLV
ncbi:hypothetical protein ACH40F_44800 [Streptomyces sp. NPDC020794]|uniref:hypothetical protein n=1 Tax=unclassified Streptomyces TaxID=2593676 RepID=UPI0036E604B7